MATLIHRFSTPVRLGETLYTAEAWGEQRGDRLWEGWIEFVSAAGDRVLSTGRETSQSHLQALTYWATGLEPIYLEGALARAVEKSHAA